MIQNIDGFGGNLQTLPWLFPPAPHYLVSVYSLSLLLSMAVDHVVSKWISAATLKFLSNLKVMFFCCNFCKYCFFLIFCFSYSELS